MLNQRVTNFIENWVNKDQILAHTQSKQTYLNFEYLGMSNYFLKNLMFQGA